MKILFMASCLAISFASHAQSVTPADFVTKTSQVRTVNHDSDQVVIYSKATRDVRKAFVSDLKPYMVYTVLLTQSSTTAPVATVLSNQLGTITWARTGTGVYTATISGTYSYTASKTFIAGAMGGTTSAVRTSSTVITVSTTSGGTAADGVLSGTPVEIRVYK